MATRWRISDGFTSFSSSPSSFSSCYRTMSYLLFSVPVLLWRRYPIFALIFWRLSKWPAWFSTSCDFWWPTSHGHHPSCLHDLSMLVSWFSAHIMTPCIPHCEFCLAEYGQWCILKSSFPLFLASVWLLFFQWHRSLQVITSKFYLHPAS